MRAGGHPTNRRLRAEFIVSLAILGAVAVLPAIVTNAYWQGVVVVSMYFAMLAIAWNILAGYTGQFSLAPAAFAMIGAYATGLLAYYYATGFAVGIPAAIVVSGGIGLILGRIVLRLRGPVGREHEPRQRLPRRERCAERDEDQEQAGHDSNRHEQSFERVLKPAHCQPQQRSRCHGWKFCSAAPKPRILPNALLLNSARSGHDIQSR